MGRMGTSTATSAYTRNRGPNRKRDPPTYFAMCYGTARYSEYTMGGEREYFSTSFITIRRALIYFYGDGTERAIARRASPNLSTTRELIMLESWSAAAPRRALWKARRSDINSQL